MLKIVRSTIAGDEILRIVTKNYSCPQEGAVCALEYRGVNDVYRYTSSAFTSYFKIYAREDLDLEAIEAEIEVVNYLKQSGLSVAYPIPALNDQYIKPLDTPEGTRYGVLFSEAEGIPCDNDTLNENETFAIGRLLSRMHAVLDTMTTSPKRWNLDEQLFLDRSMQIFWQSRRLIDQIDLPFLEEVVKELKNLIGVNSTKWKWGLCHGDIYTGNIHRNKHDVLTIFDFDFCGYGWRAYDLAPFLGIFGGGIRADMLDKRKQRLEWFLRGYECAGSLSDSEIEAIYKVFVPFRRIFNIGYLYSALINVWGNKLRNEQVRLDLKLLKEWINYYWM